MKTKGRIGSSVRDALAERLKDPEFQIEFRKAGERFVKQSVAETVRKARETSHMTQGELAKKAKMTQSVISRIENPDLDYLPSIEILSKIARALGASLKLSISFGGRTA